MGRSRGRGRCDRLARLTTRLRNLLHEYRSVPRQRVRTGAPRGTSGRRRSADIALLRASIRIPPTTIAPTPAHTGMSTFFGRSRAAQRLFCPDSARSSTSLQSGIAISLCSSQCARTGGRGRSGARSGSGCSGTRARERALALSARDIAVALKDHVAAGHRLLDDETVVRSGLQASLEESRHPLANDRSASMRTWPGAAGWTARVSSNHTHASNCSGSEAWK